MKFLDISKPLITGILLEAENKNTHLEHLEDHIFNKGFEGAKEAVAYLYSLHEMLEGNAQTPVSMTTKWDGATALICGKDPETGVIILDEDPQWVWIREDASGGYIELRLDKEYGYILNIIQGEFEMYNFELGGQDNDINIEQYQ